MSFEKSCGAIIYRNIDEKLEFLIVSDKNDGHWGFPKGHVEENENEEETAIREIYEETGLQVTLINGFRESVHYLVNKKTMKEVIFFIATAHHHDVSIQIEELSDYKWVEFKAAKQLVTYKSSKDVLEDAYKFIIIAQV